MMSRSSSCSTGGESISCIIDNLLNDPEGK